MTSNLYRDAEMAKCFTVALLLILTIDHLSGEILLREDFQEFEDNDKAVSTVR